MEDQLVEQINNWFTYHTPTPEQLPLYQRLRDEAKSLALTINTCVPDGADKMAAIRLLRQAIMTANQGIACGGK